MYLGLPSVRGADDSFVLTVKSVGSDGKSGHSHRKSVEERQMRQFAARNKETNVNHSFIPRTQRTDVMNKPLPMEEHAALLIQKLEELKREQESQELLHRRLKEVSRRKFVVGAMTVVDFSGRVRGGPRRQAGPARPRDRHAGEAAVPRRQRPGHPRRARVARLLRPLAGDIAGAGQSEGAVVAAAGPVGTAEAAPSREGRLLDVQRRLG